MLNVHLSLATNQNMWEAVLTSKHLSQVCVHTKTHQIPKNTQIQKQIPCGLKTSIYKKKKKKPDSNLWSMSACFIKLTP